jgi:peptidoglycan/xylan/chitin deacetylase (PgdA/CDA1 family)
MPRQVTVFFRFDDYSETSPLAVEAGLVGALRNNGCLATFAVIPAVTEGRYHEPGERGTHPLGAEKIRFLRQAVDDGAVDVALHGFDHRSRAHTSPHSEFVGLSLKDQSARLQQGQDFLRRMTSFDPTVFVPPWNSYDEQTLEALVHQGLTCLSANRYGPAYNGSLRFVPITTDIQNLHRAVGLASTVAANDDPIVGVLLHPYDFTESGDSRAVISCDGFDKELKWLTDQADVRVVSVSQLARENTTLDVARYRANAPSPLESVFPPFVRTTEQSPVYRSTSAVEQTKRRNAVATVSTHVGIAMLGGFATAALFSWFALAASLVALTTTSAAVLLIAVVVRARKHRSIYFRSSMLGALVSGVILAGLLRWS